MVPYTPELNLAIAAWAQKPENAEFFRRYPPQCDWLEPMRMTQTFAGSWAIFEEDTPVGLVTVHSADPYARSCEFGVLIDAASSSHPHQTAHEITNQFCSYAFDYKNLHKIYMKILDSREGLKTRLEAIGFTCESILRDSIYFQGEYRNEFLLSCLKLEFVELSPAVSYEDSKTRAKEYVKKNNSKRIKHG